MRIVLIGILLLTANCASAQHVVFGQKHPNDTLTSIYFDCKGFIYPDNVVQNTELLACKASLYDWYNTHTEYTDSILDVYNISKLRVTIESSHGQASETTYRFISSLNDTLIKEKIRYLDSLANGNGLEFYIHGFRKSYLENERDVTSVTEFGMLASELDKTRTRKNLVVRVYWDGMYDCCFSANRKKNTELFELFETAAQHAESVSNSFSKLLYSSTSASINIIGHSLGAKVAVQGVLESANYTSKFNVCLIAPAIPGSLINMYYEEMEILPSCKWLVVYNEKDFVLKKKDNKVGMFGPGAHRYGETTLGCNKNKDAEKLEKWMKEKRPNIPFNLLDKTEIGKCHSLRCYTKNDQLTEVSTFLEHL